MTGAVSDSVYLGAGEETSSSGTPAIVGAVVAGLVLLTLVSIIITLYLRRGSDEWAKKQVPVVVKLRRAGIIIIIIVYLSATHTSYA